MFFLHFFCCSFFLSVYSHWKSYRFSGWGSLASQHWHTNAVIRSLIHVVQTQNIDGAWHGRCDCVDRPDEATLWCQILFPGSAISVPTQTALKLSSASLLLSPIVVVWLLFSSIISIMWLFSSLRDDFRLFSLLLLLYCRVRTTSKLCARWRPLKSVTGAGWMLSTWCFVGWWCGDVVLFVQQKLAFVIGNIDSWALLFRVIFALEPLFRLESRSNVKLKRLLNWRRRDINDLVPLLAAELAVLRILFDMCLLCCCCCEWLCCWFSLLLSSSDSDDFKLRLMGSLRMSPPLDKSSVALFGNGMFSVIVAGTSPSKLRCCWWL